MKMNNQRGIIIIIGGRDLFKNYALEMSLMKTNQAFMIFEREVKNLENAGIPNARETLEQAMRVYSIQDLKDSFENLKETLNSLKPIPQKEPSKYFSKPKNNFKTR